MAGRIAEIVEKARGLGADFRLAEGCRLQARRFTLLPVELQRELLDHRLELLEYLANDGAVPPFKPTTANNRSVDEKDRAVHPFAIAVIKWANNTPLRWKSLKSRIIKIYQPVWERIDARDVIVSWIAAHLALPTAEEELEHYNLLRRRLTHNEIIHRNARSADVSFWGRMVKRLDVQVGPALEADAEARQMIETCIGHGEKE